jgi:hypothetical protein
MGLEIFNSKNNILLFARFWAVGTLDSSGGFRRGGLSNDAFTV